MNTHSNQAHPPQRIIGLAGGIGMGKTTVSNYLATVHQLPVLDADIYSREAVAPGSPVLGEVVERYGSGLLLPDKTLDRHRLGDIIFSSPPERLWLEQRIHPYVRDRLVAGMHTLSTEIPPHPTIVLVIPLLFEARMTDLVTETWVVRCPPEQQLERLMQRDHLSLQQARARIDSQMSIQKKATYADLVLDNTSTLEHLFQQVDAGLAQIPVRLTVPRG
ncbi:dephospho-CoA kinase [Leptolyngbya sp. FACHB-321]|uniref:dephospho-CoA kinase n=1 Tax=Leptolyngbya sp. FACHB-321 TaxID=2692807 RepID=UPI0016865653|nr:dephospho-CoA kinase [Leptolyngbya sp. FACHB-321]MBD2035277.1 dephospho-CoA kinase [Leptolyngbya sp. FACHB-321]